MVVEYVGTAYGGFQRQSNADTVQAALERAVLATTGETVTLAAAGRTDTGAHAVRQVATFDTQSVLSASALRNALNAQLPRDVAVAALNDVPSVFHPRYHAINRTYRYLIWNRSVRSPFYEERAWHVRQPLAVPTMHAAAQSLVGETDLSSFVPVHKTGSRIRRVFAANCLRDGDLVRIEITASGFMKQMTRAIVGSLVKVGRGRLDPDGFQAILEGRDRTLAAPTAPSHGLYLVDVQYDAVKYHNSPDLLVSGGIEEKG